MTDDGDLPPDLRAENARLVALLESHGIEWRRTATVDVQHTPSALNTDADEDSLEPWKPRSSATQRFAGPMPESVAVKLGQSGLCSEGTTAATAREPTGAPGRLPEP
jgi:hypothetical protein